MPDADIRLGEIDYINALPLVNWEAPADGPRVLRRRATPSELFAGLERDELDVSPVSSIAYWQARDHLTLLPELCISAAGPVQSVTLYSRLPLESLNGETIGLTPASLSSVALLKVLLSALYVHPEFEAAPESTLLTFPDRYTGILLIGDTALATRHLRPPPAPWRAYDLAEAWWTHTGLPMVFAVWVARRAWAEQHPSLLTWIHGQLRQSLTRFRQDPEPVLQQAASRLPLPRTALISYYEGLGFDLGPSQQLGLERFAVATSLSMP